MESKCEEVFVSKQVNALQKSAHFSMEESRLCLGEVGTLLWKSAHFEIDILPF